MSFVIKLMRLNQIDAEGASTHKGWSTEDQSSQVFRILSSSLLESLENPTVLRLDPGV